MSIMLSHVASGRDNNFNIVRFIAASLVLFTHSFALVSGSAESEPFRSSLGMTLGDFAVDIFFVTSGFLIAASFFGPRTFVAFFWARVLRIYPALIAAVIFCVFIVGLSFSRLPFDEYLREVDVWRYLVKNSILVFDVEYYLPGVFEDLPYARSINGSLWTLPYEIKMYACLAIIGSALLYLRALVGLSQAFIAYAVSGITGAVLLLDVYHHVVGKTSFSFYFTHLFAVFFIGASYHLWRAKIPMNGRIAFALFAVTLLVALFYVKAFYVVYIVTMPYVLFYLVYIPGGAIRSFNRLGDYSYGIYIYAFPVQQSLMSLMPNLSVFELTLYSFVLTLCLAIASWHLLEKRCLALKTVFVRSSKIA